MVGKVKIGNDRRVLGDLRLDEFRYRWLSGVISLYCGNER